MKLPIWAYGALALVLLGGLGGAVTYVRHEGYRDGEATARAECSAERAKMELANQNAIDAASKRLIELSDELALKGMQVDDYVKALDLAAASDPRAAEQCLGLDSVRRINAVR